MSVGVVRTAPEKVRAARSALVVDHPAWGIPALRLELVEDPQHPTAYTNGQVLGFNPAWILGLTFAQTVGLVAHEVCHCILGHPWRRAGRDPRDWNRATDYTINGILRAEGFELPEGGLWDPKFDGYSSEWIFDRLPALDEDEDGDGTGPGGEGQPGGDGDGSGQDGEQDESSTSDASDGDGDGTPEDTPGYSGWGDVLDAPADTGDEGEAQGSTSGSEYSPEGWQQAAQEAAQIAQIQAGDLPLGVSRILDLAQRSTVNWRAELRRWMAELAQQDYTWARPNKRYLSRGLYLPTCESEGMGTLVFVGDTSGSLDSVQLGQAQEEIREIVAEVRPERLVVIWCDTDVAGIDVFEPGDEIVLEAKGGGGTSFVPPFRLISEGRVTHRWDPAKSFTWEWDEPAAVIYFTDLDGPFPTEVPDFPVLWAWSRPSWRRGLGTVPTVPFGEVLPLD